MDSACATFEDLGVIGSDKTSPEKITTRKKASIIEKLIELYRLLPRWSIEEIGGIIGCQSDNVWKQPLSEYRMITTTLTLQALDNQLNIIIHNHSPGETELAQKYGHCNVNYELMDHHLLVFGFLALHEDLIHLKWGSSK